MKVDDTVAAFLDWHWRYHPVDATFAGARGFDERLPPSHRGVEREQRSELRALQKQVDALEATTQGERIDVRLMQAQIAIALDELERASRFGNPAWYTGEAAFGLIALLLPSAPEGAPQAFVARLEALPQFFSAAAERLSEAAVPIDWVSRARKEAAALTRLLQERKWTDFIGTRFRESSIDDAVAALQRFDSIVAALPDVDPACGRERVAFLMRTLHGFDELPEELEARASLAYKRAEEELTAMSRDLDAGASWREQLKRLSAIGVDGSRVRSECERWHRRAFDDAGSLMTPATDYGLDFESLPPWAADVAGELYFLSYRSPVPLRPGTGSIYWMGDAVQSIAAIKLIHSVHHGSVGHHTQNARARSAPSQLARLSGTDCASGILSYTAGTLVEGWACYAEDLLAEVPGFYTPEELLQLKYFEFRNIACCIADIRLHTGVWSLDEMRAFYRDDVGFAPERIWSETTRNSMFPATRLMYWTGTERIAALRKRCAMETKPFHDRLLSFGAMPVAWIEEEFER